jgi:putative phosphoserine phosphatase/1-acylglycerol-3-phosphate O-acyltransferase
MATIDELLATIEAAPRGPQVCALFDFDGTIISGYSATVFLREQIRSGQLSAREVLEVFTAMAQFGLGNLGFSALMAATGQLLRGIDEDAYRAVGEDLYRKQIARLVYPEARRLIAAHRARGHTVAIISSATPYQVEPAAKDLDIDEVMCTRLEVEDGHFTGAVERPTCFGQGKVDAAEGLAARVDGDLDHSFFYSDSTDDIQLLERVGNPVALNPSTKLRAVAHDRDWPSANFGSRGRPTMAQFLRSIAATVSLVPSFAAGLPIYALTGSRRDALNFSLSLFADAASALINLDLAVKGEENLWAQRPAVFIFNHQSKADVVIIARLLRQDIAGVGKQEIKRMPVIGKVLELGGVVMIDRKNAASAIEAMAPLVDAMRQEGKSVVLAPEGTRTISPKLGPFKKGAFHLAMQAGVPIVPIVIHNAGDVAPKGDFVFRPATVDVEVLPPVDTTDWQAETIDEHVREVRNLFLRTLGQPEEPAPTRSRGGRTARKAAVKQTTAAKTDKTAKAAKTPPAAAKKKPAAGKSAARKAATAKTTAKANAKKAAPKKATPKKAAPKKAAPKKAPAKTAAAKRPAAKATRRAGSGRPAARPKLRSS